jgi:hypothetical protein
MKKVLRLTESDLIKIVNSVINESKNERIVSGSQISNTWNQDLISKGYIPYYLDLSIDGNYRIVKVNNLNDRLPSTTFYFLTDNELTKLTTLIENVNNLISEYLHMIDLYKKQLIGVLEQKIII